MRYFYISFLLIISYSINAQNVNRLLNSKIDKGPKFSIEDTIPFVTYEKGISHGMPPAYYFNGHHVNAALPGSFDIEKITDIKVYNDSVEINSISYYGKIMIKLDEKYHPKFVTIENLINKYTNLKTLPDIIFLDDVIVLREHCDLYVDEYFILKIEVKEIESARNGNNICIVNLITRTEDNVKEANTITIRRSEEL